MSTRARGRRHFGSQATDDAANLFGSGEQLDHVLRREVPNIAGNVQLSAQLRARCFRNAKESMKLARARAFVALCDVGRYRDSGTANLVAKSEVRRERTAHRDIVN